MLRELRIKNFTIIDALSIEFGPGLNILTGETGAGKSIIVDAIDLLLGGKASPDMIKTGAKEASIEAVFDATQHPQLDELSIESDEGIILRRTLQAQGKGRSYINDTPVSIPTLSAIARSLVDIHGQHDQQGLLKKESHLSFLDAYGGFGESMQAVQKLHGEVSDMRNRTAAMKEKARERGQRIEFLRYQVTEIDVAGLKQGEKEAVEEERAILLNLSKLKESSETAYMLLYEAEGSSIEKLSAAASRIREMATIDHTAGELVEAVDAALPMLEDAALRLRDFKEKYDIDPKKLESLEERLELIKKLEKKYGENIERVLLYRDSAVEELRDLENMDESMEALETGLAAKEKELLELAHGLSVKREAMAKKMEAVVIGELHELGFQKANLTIDIRKKESVGATGIDEVEFLFSANPGEPAKPLIRVASGGELSRIMLALKCIEISAGSSDISPLSLIFDEVDAGIGGVTAQHVGNRLKKISVNYQVLCITHLPQIAALADNHLMVEKKISKDHTEVSVSPLTNGKRQEELARMLSGRITDGSLKHAQELLGSGGK